MTYVIDRSPHVLFSARRVKISACVTVESHSRITQLRPHPTFLAGGFSQQPSVSISRRHAWNNHPPDRACTLRRHCQQPLLAAAALLHPDCYYLGQHCWLAATVPLAAAAGPCRLLLVVCRVNSNCGVYRIAPSVQVGRPPRVLHDRPPVGAPCCPPGGGGGGGGGPSVDGGRGGGVVGCGGGQRHTPSVYHEPCWLPPCARLADRLWRLGSPRCWVDGACCVAVAFAVPRHASLVVSTHRGAGLVGAFGAFDGFKGGAVACCY